MAIAMMRRIKQTLQERTGEVSVRLCLILLGTVMLIIVVLNIRQAYQVRDRIIDRTNEAVLAVAAANGPGALPGLRESEALVRAYDGAYWRRQVTTSAVVDALAPSLRCTVVGNSLRQTDGAFTLNNIVTAYANSDGDTLSFRTTMDLTVYLLGGSAPITVPLEVITKYESKF